MFKPLVKLPAGVSVLQLFDRKEIDNGDASTQFFAANPSNVDNDNNYNNNPLPGPLNHVMLGLSIDCLMQIIEVTSDIDPFYLVNNLKDSTVKVESNGGRVQKILQPLKNFMNFSHTQVAGGIANDGATTPAVVKEEIAVLQSTGVRKLSNLFYFAPGESWKFSITYNSDTWPTTANWTSAGQGRFGLEVQLYMAQMNDAQLAQYNAALQAASL